MAPNRLVYFTVPGFILLLGLAWYRRKKNRTSIIDSEDISSNNLHLITQKSIEDKLNCRNSDISSSLPIANNNTSQPQSPTQTTPSSSARSDPIDITPNRSPPREHYRRKRYDIDTEPEKGDKSEELVSSSFGSSCDLPGTYEGARRFIDIAEMEKREKPIVITANCAAKISPKNSFDECKYTEVCVESRIESNLNYVNTEQCEYSNVNQVAQQMDTVSTDMEFKNINETADRNVDQLKPVVTNEQLQIETDESVTKPKSNEVPQNGPVSSPPLSLCSVRSNDSGKGSSDNSYGSPVIVYEFWLPSHLVSYLIGKKGSNVKNIKNKSGASVVVKRNIEMNKMKLVTIEGTQAEIDAALIMLRKMFSEKRFPNITFERVFLTSIPQNEMPLAALDRAYHQVQLIEGINNDVVVSSMVSPIHLFLQQPVHPTFTKFHRLQETMNSIYSSCDAPHLPEIIPDVICVGYLPNQWCRVQIVTCDPESNMYCVRLLDYGGFVTFTGEDLRQIRGDLMSVPFQATECILSNVKSPGTGWSVEATQLIATLTQQGIVLQAQIAGYHEDGYPLIYLYACIAPDNIVFVNKELIARGLAEIDGEFPELGA